MNMLHLLVAVLADFIFGDLEFVGDHDTFSRFSWPAINLQVLHLHIADNAFVTRAEGYAIGSMLLRTSGWFTTLTQPRRLRIAATDGSKTSWIFGCCPGRRERTAEQWFQPRLEQGEYHWEVGRDYGGECFPRTPLPSELCTVDGILLIK